MTKDSKTQSKMDKKKVAGKRVEEVKRGRKKT